MKSGPKSRRGKKPAEAPAKVSSPAAPAPEPVQPLKRSTLRWVLFGGIALALIFAAVAFFQGRSKHEQAALPQYNAGYIDSAECEGCHREIATTYHRTAMGRSFYLPTDKNIIEQYTGKNTFDHTSSGMHYTMFERDGHFFQRRTTTGRDGQQTNAIEEQVDYVIGSGNHARTYLHRTADGKLLELPVSWYTELGGYWAMSPGFDNPHQPDMHGPISAECMFCHNGYPTMDAAAAREADEGAVFPAKLPMGIDCQRCHGPGLHHVELARAKAPAEQVRASIANPGNMPRNRQLEVCYQCHLETSNRHTPDAVRSFDRDIFSFRPGQPLADYKIYFERPDKPKADDFEIAHAGYQLPKSACFRNSQMTCLTCHDPHNVPHGQEAIAGYIQVCQSCHTGVKHTVALPAAENCITCHMPKRRSDGSVHVVLTDHDIQRFRPTRNLLAPLAEQDPPPDHTPVVPYYPKHLPETPQTALLTAIAQVDDSDGQAGLAKLQQAIATASPTQATPYLETARALVRRNRQAESIEWFDKALSHQSDDRAALREEAFALIATGDASHATGLLRRATELHPNDDRLWTDLGNVLLRHGDSAAAADALQHAVKINPERGDAHNLLGLAALNANDRATAEREWREAERLRPDLTGSYDNLGSLLMGAQSFDEASWQLHQALHLDARDATAHHNLGLLLILQHNPAAAEGELRQAVALDPSSGPFHADYADLLAAKNAFPAAEDQYRQALSRGDANPDVQLGLGSALLHEGRASEAYEHLQAAAASSDPAVREQAQNLMHGPAR